MVTARHDVLIVGAGVIGAACALELARSGARVVVVDSGSDWGAGCSAGNAGLITPSRSLPLANRANILAGLRSMVSSDESFRMTAHRSLLGWLPKFLAASTGRGTAQRRKQLLQMGLASSELYADLAARGLTSQITAGLLHVFTRPDGWAQGLAVARADRAAELRVEVLSAQEAIEFEPTLSRATAGALFYPDDSYCDPLAMTQALGRAAVEAGAVFVPQTEVLEWRRDHRGRISSATTSRGEFGANDFVLAAGVASAQLARLAGASLPIEAGKGYSLDVGAGHVSPARAILFPEAHCVVTPLGERTRMTSRLELTGRDFSVSQTTIDTILRVATAGLLTHGDPSVLTIWRGMRPCSPDGLPFVGRMRAAENLLAATGHGMLGVTLAPLTARWVADLVGGKVSGHGLEFASPDRFSRGSAMRALPRLLPAGARS